MLFVKLVFGRVVENILRVVKNQRREITGLRSDAQGILGEFGIVGFPNGDAQRKPPLADFINRNSCGGSNRLNIHSMRPFWRLNMFAVTGARYDSAPHIAAIVVLGFPIGPPAISGLIIAIIVFSVEHSAFRAETHVLYEIIVARPAGTNRNSPPAVILPPRPVFVRASAPHGFPRVVGHPRIDNPSFPFARKRHYTSCPVIAAGNRGSPFIGLWRGGNGI